MNYRELNNFVSTSNISIIKHYLNTNELLYDRPIEGYLDWMSNDKRTEKRFRENFIAHDWELSGNNLFYKPLHLQVIEFEKEKLLQNIFSKYGLGKGIAKFYEHIRSEYLNISRDEVKEFLEKQEVYQLTFEKQKEIKKKITAKYPNQCWACDLVDMNQYLSKNKQFRYILTCIDLFSRYTWAKAIKHKDLESSKKAMKEIFDESNTRPQSIVCDNGPEFNWKDFCKENNIHLIHTETYSPTQNSLIENFNRSLRNLIRQNFIANNNLVWYNQLNKLLEIKNNTIHGTTKYKPIEVWVQGRNLAIEDKDKKDIIDNIKMKARNELLKHNERLNKAKENLFVGNIVRVRTEKLSSELRKIIKAGNSKLIIIKWSTKIYRISRIVKTKVSREFQSERYELDDPITHQPLVDKDQNIIRFTGADLLVIPAETVFQENKIDESKLNNVIVLDEDKEKSKKKKDVRADQENNTPIEERRSNRARKPNSRYVDN